MFISQLKIYKEKENLSINIYIKTTRCFSLPLLPVLPRKPQSWRSHLPTGEDLAPAQWLLGLPTRWQFWNKFLKFYFVFNLRAHTRWIWKRTSQQWALFSFFFHYCWRSIHYCYVLLVKSFVFCCVRNRISVILSTVKGKIHWGIIVSVRK